MPIGEVDDDVGRTARGNVDGLLRLVESDERTLDVELMVIVSEVDKEATDSEAEAWTENEAPAEIDADKETGPKPDPMLGLGDCIELEEG